MNHRMETLAAFYRRTVDLNDSQLGGWGSIYYGVLTKVINDNNYKIVAEIGIGYGTHAKYLMKTTKVDRLYLIDPMQYYPNDQFTDDIMKCIPKQPNNHFNEFHDLIQQELSPWSSRFTWHRVPSLSVTNDQIPDSHLDCVFVDGDHSYEAVKKDLPFWWKKVRVGGQMLGDDYWMEGVARAVHEFAQDYNLTPEFLTIPGKDYKIFSFKKSTPPSPTTLSLCIPTMDRWDFLKVNLPQYLANPYISEIVITDENGHDAEKIRTTFHDPKISVYVNGSRLGGFLNKQRVVSLAKNKFVCLIDSDNFAPLSYFEAWAKYLNGATPSENTIYSPYRTIPQADHEGFDYSFAKGVSITAKEYKYIWRTIPVSRLLYNTGNFIVSKALYDTAAIPFRAEFLGAHKGPGPLDVMFQHYLMWTYKSMVLCVVPGMDYHHKVHDGSYYLKESATIDTAAFEGLYYA